MNFNQQFSGRSTPGNSFSVRNYPLTVPVFYQIAAVFGNIIAYQIKYQYINVANWAFEGRFDFSKYITKKNILLYIIYKYICNVLYIHIICYHYNYIYIYIHMHQLSHGSEYNMTNIFCVSHIFQTYFAEITAKYEKRGKSCPHCTS